LALWEEAHSCGLPGACWPSLLATMVAVEMRRLITELAFWLVNGRFASGYLVAVLACDWIFNGPKI
jgi:hypothetical protein